MLRGSEGRQRGLTGSGAEPVLSPPKVWTGTWRLESMAGGLRGTWTEILIPPLPSLVIGQMTSPL